MFDTFRLSPLISMILQAVLGKMTFPITLLTKSICHHLKSDSSLFGTVTD